MKKVMCLLIGGVLFLLSSGCSKDLARSNPLDPNSSSNGSGNSGGNTFSVQGKTIENGTSIAVWGAPVWTAPISKNTTSDSNGNYTLSGIPSGDYTLSASAPFYANGSVPISNSGTGLTTIDIPMTLKTYFTEKFDSYASGNPLNTPWNAGVSGTASTYVSVWGGAPSAPNLYYFGCSSANSYARATYPLNSATAYGLRCWMSIYNTGNQPNSRFIVALTDSGFNKIADLGIIYSGGTLQLRYSTGAVAEYIVPGYSISSIVSYFLEIWADNTSNSAVFCVRNATGSVLWKSGSIQIYPAVPLNFGGCKLELTYGPAAGTEMSAFIDDLKVIPK